MKTITLTFYATLMLCSFSLAQQPTPPASKAVQPISENYVVTLTMTDKEQKPSELSLVVASQEFTTNFPDAQSNSNSFGGMLIPEEGDIILFKYSLSGQITISMASHTTELRTITTTSAVRLKLGEPVQILKTDTRTCTLSVSRLSDQHTGGK